MTPKEFESNGLNGFMIYSNHVNADESSMYFSVKRIQTNKGKRNII